MDELLGIVRIMDFGGRVIWSEKVLDQGNNPPFIIRYRFRCIYTLNHILINLNLEKVEICFVE
jgi:hypothetical protein